MSEQRNPVVASLPNRAQHPYSAIALSPDRKNAVAAGKDTLRVLSIGPQGLREIISLRISQHFQAAVATSTPRSQARYRDVRDAFGAQKTTSPQNLVSTTSTVAVTDVAWSLPQGDDDDIVAAAGSNGVVVVWSAQKGLLNPTATSSMAAAPDAVLSQHSRAVNRLAWHPSAKRAGLLLTASQDSTVKLWERRASSGPMGGSQGNPNIISWFSMPHSDPKHKSISWHCLATYEPKAEAVRDIRWSPFFDDVFAMVTDTGSLIIYNINIPATAWVRILAHDGEATSLDWHPSRPYIVATGGAGDRSVKVWDLEMAMSLHGKGFNAASNRSSGSAASDRSEDSRTGIVEEDTIPRSGSGSAATSSTRSVATGGFKGSNQGSGSLGSTLRSGKTRPSNLLHVLHISASVTRVIWRPPAGLHSPIDIHEYMLAVATAPIKGASAGGNGLLSLWTSQRPYMALSVVEGHKEGSVTDFVWLDFPVDETIPSIQDSTNDSSSLRSRIGTPVFGSDSIGTPVMGSMLRRHSTNKGAFQGGRPHPFNATSMSRSDTEDSINDEKDNDADSASTLEGTWQHVLSVGRDGRCVIQSFARGDRPIARVSRSCFAIANLSPFQRGYGSLQIFSVHQSVPNGRLDDFALTGLRQDAATSKAPGVFREPVILSSRDLVQANKRQIVVPGTRIPSASPQLVFNVIDQGDLDGDSKPIDSLSVETVAPEVVHMSRFANSYKLYPDDVCPTRVSLCLHNADVAEKLRCSTLARMWKMVAELLEGAKLDHLSPKGAKLCNALQFALLPCVRQLLEDRAESGDVQTCVALCEILQVLQVDSDKTTTCIPGLPVQSVREWYLSYVDLLQQMCLFSHASFVIKKCADPVVGALNKQSTSFNESCPHCGKALLAGEGDSTLEDETGVMPSIARRSCNSCRRRIGFCFLCHEPVSGVFVWCPGCGHGGHLDHALEWFGGMDGKPVREACPTGCGHQCNLSRQLSAFPRTDSFLAFQCQPVGEN